MLCVKNGMAASITPEPSDAERAAILEALGAGEPPPNESGWAAAALAEGVSGEEPDPLQQHDVCSLW